MAVSPTQPSSVATPGLTVPGTARVFTRDVLLAVLICVTVPLALVTVPNTVSLVAALLPDGVSTPDMVRAHGLALPALILAVPLTAALLHRLPAPPVILAGLALLAAADVAGGYAASVPLVGAVRVVQGAAAGALLAATLTAAWRRVALRALWAGSLAPGLLVAQALALWPLDDATSWQVTLQLYPLPTGIGLALAAVHTLLWLIGPREDEPRPTAAERGRLLFAAVPAAAVALVALATAHGWGADLLIVAAVLSLAALLVLAVSGTARAGGAFARGAAFTLIVVGAVVLPTSAQVTNVELRGLGGPGLAGLWVPFAVAAALAIACAAVAARMRDPVLSRLPVVGAFVIVAGLAAVRLLVPSADGLPLIVPFGLFAGGVTLVVTAALRRTELAVALFALSLCFPAVLAGFLLGTGIQMPRLHAATSSQALADAFVDATHLWALAGGFLVVAVIVLDRVLPRPAMEHHRNTAEPGRTQRIGKRSQNAEGGRPSVPPPTRSPETTGRDDVI